MTQKKKAKRTLLFLTIITAEYILCRWVLFDLHGMKDWPAVLAILALVMLFFFSRKEIWEGVMGLTVSYPLGLLAGAFLHRGDALGQDNLWKIWLLVLISGAVAGLLVGIIRILVHRNRSK